MARITRKAQVSLFLSVSAGVTSTSTCSAGLYGVFDIGANRSGNRVVVEPEIVAPASLPVGRAWRDIHRCDGAHEGAHGVDRVIERCAGGVTVADQCVDRLI